MGWAVWVDLLVRSAVVLAGGELLRRCYARRGAAFRHRVASWALGIVAMLPILVWVCPEIRIPVWNTPQTGGQVTVEQTSFVLKKAGQFQPMDWLLVLWAAGFFATLVPLTAGYATARKLVREGKRAEGACWDGVQEELSAERPSGPEPTVILSERLRVPLTCGVWRPSIVLPTAAEAWEPSRKRAVLLHEIAHIRRRDVAVQLGTQLVAAMWWFQPLVWWLLRTVRRESELACDAEVLTRGVRPSEYAAELLAIAQEAGGRRRFVQAGISMAQRGDLEERVRSILAPRTMLLTNARGWTAAVLLGAVAIGASTVTGTPKHDLYGRGGPIMKRSALLTLLTSAGLSAATISGSVFDPTGASIPGAKVSLYNANTGAKQEIESGSDGKFASQEIPAGQYILRVEKPGFGPLLREYAVKADSKIERGLQLNTATVQQNAQAQERGDSAGADEEAPTVRIGGRVAEANLISKKQPVYPTAAKAARVQGTVELEATISKEGVPTELRVLSSPSDDLTQASLEAVGQWRYRPTLLNGNPVQIVTDVIVNFTLSQ